MKKVYSKKQLTRVGRFLSEQCFIRESKKALFLILCVLISSYSFAQDAFTVTWPLTVDASVTKTGVGAGAVTANAVYVGAQYRYQVYGSRGLEIAEGATQTVIDTYAWAGRGTANPNADFTLPPSVVTCNNCNNDDMFVEFAIAAGATKDLKITKINIPLSRPGATSTPAYNNGNLHYNIAYILDGVVVYIKGDASDVTKPLSTTTTISSLDYNTEVIVPKNKTLKVRFMVWRRNSANTGSANESRIAIGSTSSVTNGVIIEGETITTTPVSLITFTGKKQSDGIALNWTTASEKDNSHFDILRSVDGKTFDKIDRIKGSGTSEKINRYTYTDTQPLKGTTYYQLRQVDFNGDSELSNIISVDNELLTKDLQAFVTADGQVAVIYQADRVSPAQLSLYDISGRRIINHLVQLQKGNNHMRIPVNLMNRGVYIIKIKAGETEFVTKFLK